MRLFITNMAFKVSVFGAVVRRERRFGGGRRWCGIKIYSEGFDEVEVLRDGEVISFWWIGVDMR